MHDHVDRAGNLTANGPGIGRLTLAIRIMLSTRASASRAELEWIVDMEPLCPVFIACIMSKASGPRTSPTMIRSGRMRSALRTRSRWAICPWPSMLGGRVSN